MEGPQERNRSLLPKLVMDWGKIVGLASKGYVDLLKIAVEHSLAQGTAKLVQNRHSPASVQPVILSVPVVQATWGGRTDVVRYLVDNFSDIVLEEGEISRPPHSNKTWSLHCCSARHTDSVFHRHGPYMASHIAASLGNVDILRLWGESCVEWRDDLGRTPLHWAAYYGQKTVVEYLLSIGAPVNATNIYGITPLLDCVCAIWKITSDFGTYLEVLVLLLESGACVEDSLSAEFIEVVTQSVSCLSEDETRGLLSHMACVGKEAVKSIGKLFRMYVAPNEESIVTEKSTSQFFCYFVRFLGFFCTDLSEIRILWERAFQLEAEQGAYPTYMPAIQVYGDREEVASWVEAESIISQVELSSDPTEVVYQCAIMLERVLGASNPRTIELLCNAHTFMGLKQGFPIKAVGDMFLHAMELLESIISTPTQNKYSFYLHSPIGYFDRLVKENLVPDFVRALTVLLKTLHCVYKKDEEMQTGGLQEVSNYCAGVGFALLCRMAYRALRNGGSDELPQDIDELGVELMSMCPPLISYYYIRRGTPSWLRDEEEEVAYIDSVIQCYQSWVIRTGSLYTPDQDGDMLVNYIIKALELDKFELEKPLLDFTLEHGSHIDAVDSFNQNPYEDLMERYQLNNYGDIVRNAITKPPNVLPLTCIAARAVISRHISYHKATGYLPPHIVAFISMHDCKRPRNLFISHKNDYFKISKNGTRIVAEFDIPL